MRTRSRPGLFYSDGGEGEPVLLITGWTISSAVFEPVAAHYLPHARVIAYDHRGSGRSAPWPAPVSMAMLAADAARVLDERGVRCAHIVGVSMGAMVGLELAVRMPSRVKSLVLIGGGTGGPLSQTPDPIVTARALAELAADSVRHGRLWPAAALFSRRFRTEQPERVIELVRPFTRHRPPPWTAGFQTLAASCFGRHEALGRVRAPTLVLHGDEDVMSPVGNALLLAQAIPGAELHLERGAGHAVPLERPQACAEVLLDWVARHAGHEPAAPAPWDALTERVTRPFSLHAGALRNSRQVPAAVWRRLGWPV